MRIKDISVENYRNLNSATITFDESCNFIVGENNLGKSNILNLLNINPEKPDVPLNKNDAFQKVQKRRVQEKR